jgi:hypothetical protein
MVARSYYDKQRLAASFFSRGGGDVGRADKFVTSIALQLAHSVEASPVYISKALAERSIIHLGLSLHEEIDAHWSKLSSVLIR